MNDLFSSFRASTKEEWIAILQKELKGESIDTLNKVNRVEEIAFPSYFHKEDQKSHFSDPGMAPFTRGIQSKNNDWTIATAFRITDAAQNNKEIVAALMSGTDHLVLEAVNSDAIDFATLLNEVGLKLFGGLAHGLAGVACGFAFQLRQGVEVQIAAGRGAGDVAHGVALKGVWR